MIDLISDNEYEDTGQFDDVHVFTIHMTADLNNDLLVIFLFQLFAYQSRFDLITFRVILFSYFSYFLVSLDMIRFKVILFPFKIRIFYAYAKTSLQNFSSSFSF